MKKIILRASLFVGVLFVGFVIYFYPNLKDKWDSKVTQEVKNIKLSGGMERVALEELLYQKIQVINFSLLAFPNDTAVKILKLNNEINRLLHSEYFLTTKNNWETQYDFGDAHFIDSVKCIRLNEVKNRVKEHQRLDSIADAENELRKQELKRLNKSCE